MPDSKRAKTHKKSPVAEKFDVGDEVELLTWRIFGSKGTITSTQSSPFRHPFHVKTDLGYTVGVFPNEIRHLATGLSVSVEEQPSRRTGRKGNQKRRQ